MSTSRRFHSRTRFRPILPLVSALSLMLAACGGGGSDGPTNADNNGGGGVVDGGNGGGGTGGGNGSDGTGPGDGAVPTPVLKTFAGVVRSAEAVVPAATVVCADRNGDLACGSDEEQAVVDATTGAFHFDASVSDATATPSWPLVAVVPVTAGDGLSVDSTRTHYSLAASADATVIDAVTTLQWAGARAPSTLASDLDLHSETDPRAVRIRGLLHPALIQTADTIGRQSPATAEPELTRLAANALAKVAPGYVDPDSRQFLRTITARTLRAEAVQEQLGVAGACTHDAIPTISIDTKGIAIDTKDNYVTADITIAGAGLTTTTYEKAGIRGRGNSTWELDKKPYRLKLDKAASVLGLPPEKDWVLLANHIDKSLLRNDLTFCMGRLLGLDFTPSSRHVEVTLNGDYVGVYQLTEQIETGRHRVDLEEDENQTNPADLAFLLEIDGRQDEDFSFWSTRYGVPYMAKTDTGAAQEPLITDYIDSLEASLASDALLDETNGYGRWLDASTLVDIYLINELSRNGDAFTSSAYAWRAGQSLLKFGPLWDFDIAYGNANYTNPLTGPVDETTQGWWARKFSYVERLLEADPDFQRHVAARWAFLHGRLASLQQFIDDGAAHLGAAQTRNFARWPILDRTVAVNHVIHGGTYEGEVAFLHDWLNDRAAWLDREFLAEFPPRPTN